MVGSKELKLTRAGVRTEWILSLGLVLFVVAVYHPVGSFEFVHFDDNLYVTENLHVQDGLNLKNIAWALKSTRASNWHPLTWISHMLDYQLYGLNPGMHHITSLIIHAVNCLLLFLILNRITGTVWQSAIVAGLFGLHPINVDSVVWIAERKNILSTFFCMLTLLTYSYYVEKPRFGIYTLTLILFALGLMTKPIIVSIPFALLLLDYWPLNRLQSPKSVFPLILEKIPFILLAILSIVISYVIVQEDSILITTDTRSMTLRLANAVTAYITYIGKMLWPVNLSIFYPYPKTIPFWKTLMACVLLVGVSIYSIRLGKQHAYLITGWYWYLLTLFPFIGQLQAGLWPAMADRWAYIPFIGLFVGIAWAGTEVCSKINIGRTAIGIIILVIFSVLTFRTWFQIQHWRNSVTLFKHALASTSDNYVIHNNLANVLEWKGNIFEAKAHYMEALRINPEFITARYNLGNLFKTEGRMTEAVEQYKAVLRMNPEHVPAHNNLATTLINVTEIERIIDDCSKLEERPQDLTAIRHQLKSARHLQDMMDEAIYHFKEVLRITPDSDTTSENIRQALMFRKKLDKAIEELFNARQMLKEPKHDHKP